MSRSRVTSNHSAPAGGVRSWSSASAEQLLRIVEVAEDAIISVDRKYRIILFNQGAAHVFGYTPEEALGRPLSMLLPDRFREAHDDHVQDFVESPESARRMAERREIFGRRKNGEEFPAEASIAKIDADGELILTVILRDINERKAAERRLQSSLREKEVLLREVHHRVKNNLQVVSSLLSLQERALRDPALRHALSESRNRIQSMALIHEQLYNAGDLSQVNFPEYVRQLTARLLHSYQVDPHQVDLDVDVGDVGLSVDVAVPCGLILNELVSNSLKYAFCDGRSGEIRIEFSSMPDGSVILTAADDGVGLPPEVGFWSTRTLGLRLVRSLVRQLDGEVELSGPPGTEFRIRFSPEEATRINGR